MQNRKVRVRLAGALAIVGVLMLTFSSVAIAQGGPSEFPPPPPSPLSPPEWDEDAPLMPMLADVNLDGEIDVRDVILLRRYLVGLASLSPTQLAVADALGNGEWDVRDVIRLRRFIVDPYATSGVLQERMWQFGNPRHQMLLDPLQQNVG